MRPLFPLAPALKFYLGEDDFGLSGLTVGERMFLWRRRVGLTQKAACERFDLTPTAYGEAERGAVAAPLWTIPWSGRNYLSDGERCAIHRRRAALRQHQVATEIGCTPAMISEMERDVRNCELLLMYWRWRLVSHY